MLNYLNVTYNQLLQDFKARLASDERFKNIGSSTIYGMFMEMIAAVTDMTNFYIQRTAEEGFISTARLDSSIIKHCKNLGYNPRRPVPARCELVIRIKGPLPKEIKAGTEVFFNRDTTKLTFNGNPYILDTGYSYVFTAEDIANGESSDWYKDLSFAVPQEAAEYSPLAGMNYYNTTETTPIKCFQAEQKTVEILGTANLRKIGEPCQFYDVDDINFSNWYGKRDPYAYQENVYMPEISWCKVGIGPDEETAMNDENLYTIETQSIYLNDDIVNLAGRTPEEPFKICLVDTNPDKTVRVTFSSEPNIADIGLKTYKDNLYIKYLTTKGKECNTTGVKGAVMSHNNQINACVDGSVVSLTNNIQFIVNSDIYGGEDFESQASMKINAPAYFSSRGKLITRDDFMSYFRGLTSPMTVQTAMVFGQHDIEDTINVLHPLCQNNIFYCLMGHLYVKNPKGNWTIRNVLTELDSGTTDTFSLYGDKYLDHLCDYVKMLYSYESYYNKQYIKEADEQWLKNIRLINLNCAHNTEINSVLMSLPPYVQYFDAVGTVYVKPLTDIEAYTNEMKNKVYQYLDERVPKHKKIYKSEIIKLYNEHPATVSTDIDFKISDIVQSPVQKYVLSASKLSDFEMIQNKSLESYIKTAALYYDPDEGIGNAYGLGWWNELRIPKLDQNGNILSPGMFENRNITIEITFLDKANDPSSNYFTENTNTYEFTCDVSSDDNYISLCPIALQPEGSVGMLPQHATDAYFRYMESRVDYNPALIPDGTSVKNGIISFTIKLPTTNDFYSSTNFSIYKVEEYGLPTDTIISIQNDLNEWLKEGLYGTNDAARAINLPYTVKTVDEITRDEEIMRKGHLIQQDEKTLSENSFWNFFVPKILSYYNITKYTDDTAIATDIDSNTWQCATNLIMDIYAKVKPGICDSILDNNNNITNFSTDMERACLQNKINVRYSQN